MHRMTRPVLPARRTATRARFIATIAAVTANAATACSSDQGPADARTGSTMSTTPDRKSAPSKYRFERPPTVVFTLEDSNAEFHVFARMNRPLPRDTHGIKATFLVDGSRPFATPSTNPRHPPCYYTPISAGDNPRAAPEIVDPHDGQLVTVTLRFPGRDVAEAVVAARKVEPRAVGLDQTDAKYLRRLGCHIATG
jgi:hypothetical protein